LLVAMKIVRRIINGTLRHGLYEIFARKHSRHKHARAPGKHTNATAESPTMPRHSAIIEGQGAERAV
jgi:hypothetical protein